MKAARVGVFTAAILAVAMSASAQKPDFSGTWTLDPSSAPAKGGDGGSALGNGPATVKQTAETLTIQRTIGGDAVTLTFQLDGTGTRNVLESRDGRAIDSLSFAKWDGSRLTIVTKHESDGALVEATQVWSLAGDRLTVETTGANGTQKRIYKK
jgi:hypothetical protein